MGKVTAFSWSGVGGTPKVCVISQSWKSRIQAIAEQIRSFPGQKEKKLCWVSASSLGESETSEEKSTTTFDFSTWENCAAVFLPFGLFPLLLNLLLKHFNYIQGS